MNKIKEFVHLNNARLSQEDNIRVKNRSDHENTIHQALFNVIDEFAKRVVKDINNSFSKSMFETNRLNIVADEKTIENVIIESLKRQGHDVKSLNNPEMIYRAYNFIKPDSLLPAFNNKLILIKQLGIDESGDEISYVINPYFFGFKLSFDIFINSLFIEKSDPTIEKGLVSILKDKYGEEFGEIYKYVSYIAGKSINEGRAKGDQEDETFIKGVKSISGIEDDKIFYNFIYESAMMTATNNASAVGGE